MSAGFFDKNAGGIIHQDGEEKYQNVFRDEIHIKDTAEKKKTSPPETMWDCKIHSRYENEKN